MRRTLDEWLELQQSVHARSIDLGLERVAQVAERLGVARPRYRVITVGGTNGKGSTVAHLEAVLRSAGTAVGAFTSPHLVRYHERIRLHGELVDDASLIDAFEQIEAARGATTLTFFEYNTLAALLLFARAKVEIAVLEVGLGGRLDATNLIDADVAVLTSIGLDHLDWLGETLEAIGAEKAGIFRQGRPAILGTPEMPRSVYERIAACGARAVIAGRDYRYRVEAERWRYTSERLDLAGLPRSALGGRAQYANAASAIAAIEWLQMGVRLDVPTVSAALRGVVLPGRFQIVEGRPEWILDVAHNEQAARVLAQELRARPSSGRSIAVVGILRDKDPAAIAGALQGCIDRWILCSLPGPRGLTADELAFRLGETARGAASEATVASACSRAAAEAGAEDRIVVFGSFLTVGPALEWLRLY
ncbi:MAG: bifunctional tetrahydrofolate synthase/dihydrofolate synthase [Steroidobacteraceae bacterium]